MQSITLDSAVDTPALLVDVTIMDANIREMAQLCAQHGVQFYPHAKTHRIPEIGLRQVGLGAAGLTVAKLGEAEGFAAAGIRRLIVAYPLVGRAKLERAVRLAQEVDELVLCADDAGAIRAIGEAFAAADQTATVFVLVDTGLGRCGVAPQAAASLVAATAHLPGVDVAGILTHEGSVYGAANTDDLVARSRGAVSMMVDAARPVRATRPAFVVSMGASASARIIAGEPGVTQLRPGISTFNDRGQIALSNATTDTCAVRVLATVVSTPSADRACIDAGSKSLSQDGVPAGAMGDNTGHGLLCDRPGWLIDRLSEEHGWLRWAGAGEPTRLTIGEQLQIVPNHVCTVFSSMGVAVAVDHGTVIGQWAGLERTASR